MCNCTKKQKYQFQRLSEAWLDEPPRVAGIGIFSFFGTVTHFEASGAEIIGFLIQLCNLEHLDAKVYNCTKKPIISALEAPKCVTIPKKQ